MPNYLWFSDATFKPIVDIVRKQLPSGFIATLTN
jgi:hypothetical protein